jgi:HrpA-like RNA helicase
MKRITTKKSDDSPKGVFDHKFINNNPLTDKPYSEEYKTLFNKLIELQAYKEKELIVNTIKKNQVTIITASTGVGKTVWVPKFALHAIDYKSKIAVTNPKRITTKSNAEFSAKGLDVNIGEEVGYKYRNSPKNSFNKDTKLLFCTDGYLSARILGSDPLLKDYSMVMLDEVHERKTNIDLLLYLLREIARKRKDFKILLVSATLDEKIFKDYYPKSEFKIGHVDLKIPTTYPIKVHYEKQPIKQNEYVLRGIDKIINIINTTDDGSILFFVTSANETKDACELLSKKLDGGTHTGVKEQACVEIYSGVGPKNEELAQDPILYKSLPGEPKRKVIIATNVVESSLTVSDLKYVVDSGYEFFVHYDPMLNAKIMDKQFTTKAQTKQRRGRVGRTSPGVCYHLFTEKEYEKFRDYPLSDIQKSDITLEILRFMNLDVDVDSTKNISNIDGTGDSTEKSTSTEDAESNTTLLQASSITATRNTVKSVKDLLNNLIEPPNLELVNSSFKQLFLLDAIDMTKDEGVITKTGKRILGLRAFDLNMGKAMLKGFKYGCVRDVAIIASMIDLMRNNMGNLVTKIPDKNISKNKIAVLTKKKEKGLSKLRHKYGDHLTLLNVYIAYRDKKNVLLNKYTDRNKAYDELRTWCFDHFLKYDVLRKVKSKAREYTRTVFRLHKPPVKALEPVKDSVATGEGESTTEPTVTGEPTTEPLVASGGDLSRLVKRKQRKELLAGAATNTKQHDDLCIMRALFRGLYNKSAQLDKGRYRLCFKDTNRKAELSKTSFFNMIKTKPKNVIFNELFIMGDNPELNIVSEIPVEIYKKYDKFMNKC